MKVIRKITFRFDEKNEGEIKEATINFGEEKEVKKFVLGENSQREDEFENLLRCYAMELLLKQGFFHVFIDSFEKVF